MYRQSVNHGGKVLAASTWLGVLGIFWQHRTLAFTHSFVIVIRLVFVKWVSVYILAS